MEKQANSGPRPWKYQWTLSVSSTGQPMTASWSHSALREYSVTLEYLVSKVAGHPWDKFMNLRYMAKSKLQRSPNSMRGKEIYNLSHGFLYERGEKNNKKELIFKFPNSMFGIWNYRRRRGDDFWRLRQRTINVVKKVLRIEQQKINLVAPEKIIGRGKLDSNHTEHCLKRKRRA